MGARCKFLIDIVNKVDCHLTVGSQDQLPFNPVFFHGLSDQASIGGIILHQEDRNAGGGITGLGCLRLGE